MICTYDRAFKPEFTSGFDVVIGNPPYVDIKGMDTKIVQAFFEKYETVENRINLYSIFIEKGYDLLKYKGFLSFINPNSILVNSSYEKIRRLLIDDMSAIIKLPDDVFIDAKVETIIFELRKKSKLRKLKKIVYHKNDKINFIDETKASFISKTDWKKDNYNYNIYISPKQLELLNNLRLNSFDLSEIADFSLGITPYDKYKGHSPELIKNKEYHSPIKKDETYKPLISGSNIERYFIDNQPSEFIKYGEWLGAPREKKFFRKPRIIVRQIVSGKPPRIYAGYSEEELYFTQIGFAVIPKQSTISVLTLCALMNSKLINFYHTYQFLDLEKELFQKILIANCKKFPIKRGILKSEYKSLENLVIQTNQIKTNKKNKLDKFQTYLLS